MRQLVERFPNANIGIVTGLSNLTIVDIDDPNLVDDMLLRFGETPIITQSPSRGAHLWYTSTGERNANLRVSANLPVDIKGKGGILVIPPSGTA